MPGRGGDWGGDRVIGLVCGGTLSSGAFSSFSGVWMLFVWVLSTLSSGAVVGALFLVCRGREEVSCTGTSGAMRTVGVGSRGGCYCERVTRLWVYLSSLGFVGENVS